MGLYQSKPTCSACRWTYCRKVASSTRWYLRNSPETGRAVDKLFLEDDLCDLLAAVGSRWEPACEEENCLEEPEKLTDLQIYPMYMIGPDCIQVGENCKLDNWDATFRLRSHVPQQRGSLCSRRHPWYLCKETEDATYVGLGTNQVGILNGFKNLFNEDFAESGDGYSNERENTDRFFLY